MAGRNGVCGDVEKLCRGVSLPCSGMHCTGVVVPFSSVANDVGAAGSSFPQVSEHKNTQEQTRTKKRMHVDDNSLLMTN